MLQLVRETKIRIVIHQTPSVRRGFLFHVAAGFSHDVDPLSGMSVNLMDVDGWLGELKKSLEGDLWQCTHENLNPTFFEIMATSKSLLKKAVAKQGAVLTSLSFREERGWSFTWKSDLAPEWLLYTYNSFLEWVPAQDPKADLLRIHLQWQRPKNCLEDCQHQTFLALKSASDGSAAELISNLSQLIGRQLKSGTQLNNITIDFLGEGYSLSLVP